LDIVFRRISRNFRKIIYAFSGKRATVKK